jgi:transposase
MGRYFPLLPAHFFHRSIDMSAPRKWPPANALEDIERLACKGWSTIGLAKHFGVSRSTITRWLSESQKLEDAYEQGRDSYRQALEEQIIQMTLAGKNPAGLIYLLKAKFKMFDVPNNKPDPTNVAVEIKPVMYVVDHGSDADWEAKALEQQRKLTAPTVGAKLAVAPSDEVMPPILSAPAWAPKGLR